MRTFDAAPAHHRLRLLLTDSPGDLSVRLGLDRKTVRTVLSSARLRWDAADRIAVALGCHPCELWPDWFDEDRGYRAGPAAGATQGPRDIRP